MRVKYFSLNCIRWDSVSGQNRQTGFYSPYTAGVSAFSATQQKRLSLQNVFCKLLFRSCPETRKNCGRIETSTFHPAFSFMNTPVYIVVWAIQTQESVIRRLWPVSRLIWFMVYLSAIRAPPRTCQAGNGSLLFIPDACLPLLEHPVCRSHAPVANQRFPFAAFLQLRRTCV